MFYKYVINNQVVAILYGKINRAYGCELEIVKVFNPSPILDLKVGQTELFWARLDDISELSNIEKVKYL